MILPRASTHLNPALLWGRDLAAGNITGGFKGGGRGRAKMPEVTRSLQSTSKLTLQMRKVVSFWGTLSPDPLPGLSPWTPLGDFRPPDPLNWPPPSSFSGSAPGQHSEFRIQFKQFRTCPVHSRTKFYRTTHTF